jgi:hypothetical protein
MPTVDRKAESQEAYWKSTYRLKEILKTYTYENEAETNPRTYLVQLESYTSMCAVSIGFSIVPVFKVRWWPGRTG